MVTIKKYNLQYGKRYAKIHDKNNEVLIKSPVIFFYLTAADRKNRQPD